MCFRVYSYKLYLIIYNSYFAYKNNSLTHYTRGTLYYSCSLLIYFFLSLIYIFLDKHTFRMAPKGNPKKRKVSTSAFKSLVAGKP